MQGSELEKLAALDWLAFRYIANELSDEERDAFELRLISEQSLREAVARAVELSQAVAVVSREMPATLPIESRRILPFARPVGWMALGAAASLLLLFALRWNPNVANVADQNSSRPAGVPAAVQPGEPSLAVRELALYWAQSAEASVAEVSELAASEPVDESSTDELNSAPDELESPVPSWLLVAVSGERSHTPQQPNQE